MKYHINREDTYSFATIIPKKNPTVTAIITVDIHTESSIENQTTQLMFADALMSGNSIKTREEFLNSVNLLGASVSVSVQNGHLNISLKSKSDQFSKLLKLVEEMLTSPTFVKKEFARIQSTLKNELHEAKEDSRTIALSGLRNRIYGMGDRKYSFEIDELVSEVENVSAKHLKKLHELSLSQFWTCSIAAEREHCENLEKLVKKLKKKNKTTEAISIHQQKPPSSKAVLKHIPSRTNIDFSIGAPLPITLHHPDFIPLSLGLAVLAKWGGFSGRLMSTVREIEGLTYGIYGQLEGFSGTEQGYWRIMTFFAPDKALQGLTSTFREITEIYQKGISEEELDRFKTITSTQQALLNDSIGGLLADLHSYHNHKFTLEEMKEHKARISSLTLEEVNDAIRTHLNPADLTVSGAGPTKGVKKDIDNFIKNVR